MLNEKQMEDVSQIAKEVASAIVTELKLDEPIRKFTPGAGADGKEGETEVKVISDPNERLLADPKCGFRHMAHFLTDVASDSHATEALPRFQKALQIIGKTTGYMEEGDLSQGGYLVPEEFKATLLAHQLEESIVRSRAISMPMSSPSCVIPAMVDTDHSSNYFGGIVVYRRGEGATGTVTNPKFGQVRLTLHELDGFCYISNELLNDTPMSLESIVKAQFTASINFQEDSDFLVGTGANQALGAFNASNPSLVAVAKETAQTADTIIVENIVKMWARLHPRCHKKAVWVANIECFPQMALMTLAVGTGGVPVWMPANGVSGNPYDTLMGRPVIWSEKMQALGDQGDIGLADFSQYLIGTKSGGINMAASMHVRFLYNEMAYRFILRVDGRPWWL